MYILYKQAVINIILDILIAACFIFNNLYIKTLFTSLYVQIKQ